MQLHIERIKRFFKKLNCERILGKIGEYLWSLVCGLFKPTCRNMLQH